MQASVLFKEWLWRYERHLSSLALVLGFIVDSLTLRRVDLLLENVVLVSYLGIAGAGIVLTHLHGAQKICGALVATASPLVPIAMQFAFGGLFSAFFIFYTRSAALGESWLFLVFLLALLIGNERFRARYTRLSFQVTIFFIALFSFFIFSVPVVVKTMGTLIFLLSGAVSLAVISFLVYLLRLIIPDNVHRAWKHIWRGIGGAYLVINLLYFANMIPPIPLALKDAGIYHGVTRTTDGTYEVLDEKRSLVELIKPYHTIHVVPGEPVYAWSAVFAPTKLSTTVLHRWQYFDEQKDSWVTTTQIPFSVSGGRDGGYRGYSYKTALTQGKWRVDVVTPGGQVVGRMKFTVHYVDTSPELHREAR